MEHLRTLWRASRALWLTLPVWLPAGGYVIYSADPREALVMATLLLCIALVLRRLAGQLGDLLATTGKTLGSAELATTNEIASAGLLGQWFGRPGLMLGRHEGRTLRYAGDGHLLTFAPTRSGKGVGCVIPNLLDFRDSVFVLDIKGENHDVTASWRRGVGRVHTLAPFDPAKATDRFNPIDFVRTGTPYDVDDARLIAEMLVDTNGLDPNHWDREARSLLTALVLFVIYHRNPARRTLREVRTLLMRDRDGFDAVLEAMRQSEHPSIASAAEGFLQKEPKERSYVVSSAQSRTEIFESPQLTAMTADSTFLLDALKATPTTIYLIIPPEYLGVYRPFLRLMTGITMATLLRQRRRTDRRVLFVLDELPALGYMRPVEEGIGYLAGFGVQLWLFAQDLDQLEKTYPKARSMIANCAVRQAFNPQDPATARLLSDMLGVTTVTTTSEGRTAGLPFAALAGSFQMGTSHAARPLMTPDEVMRLPKDKQLIFVQGAKPILATKIRYFAWSEWRLRWRARKG